MMTITKKLILTSLSLPCAAPISAQDGNGGGDYAVTASNVTLAKPVALPIDSDGMTVSCNDQTSTGTTGAWLLYFSKRNGGALGRIRRSQSRVTLYSN
ncbi:MAG: hypothetical protein ACSHX9_01195 [Luteolibacter sp.]